MATTYDEIYDLCLVSLRDYKLDELYDTSVVNFKLYLEGFLLRAIPKFTNCVQDLTDRNDTTQTFNITLSDKEKDILASLTGIEWFKKEIQDVTQFNLHLNDTDFKHYAEGQYLKEKSEFYDREREKINQEMVDYSLKHTDWVAWANGNFGLEG